MSERDADAPSAHAPLSGTDRKWLRGKAHHLDPLVQIGKAGLSEGVLAATNEALEGHELVKVRFYDFKDEKRTISATLADRLGADLVGTIGNIAIFYRAHADPEKRKLQLPGRAGQA